MKLQNSLYTISGETHTESIHNYTIRLDADHFIYKAHFPGEPITPGVCIMQIAHELTERTLGAKLNIACVKNVKFLNIITPTASPEVHYTLSKMTDDGHEVKVQVAVSDANSIYAKLSLILNR